MTIYLDTSVIVSALTREQQSDAVIAWLATNVFHGFAVSDWCQTEVASALSLKLRLGYLDRIQLREAELQFDQMRAAMMRVGVHASAFLEATQIVRTTNVGIRAGDALHLAVVREANCRLATRDDVMRRTAQELGVTLAELAL